MNGFINKRNSIIVRYPEAISEKVVSRKILKKRTITLSVSDTHHPYLLEEILIKNKPSEIILYFSDKDVSEAIKKLSKNLGIKFILKKISSRKNHKYKSILHYIYFKSPYILQAFVYLFKIVFIHWPLKKTYKTKWFDEKKAIFFSSYLFHLDYTKFKEGEYKTGQWGPITELLKELSIKSNWLHHFLPSTIIPNTKVGINFINKLNNNPNTNGFHQFVFDGVEFLAQTPRLAQCPAPGDIDYADGNLQITM